MNFRTPVTNIQLAIENWRESARNEDYYLNIIDERTGI